MNLISFSKKKLILLSFLFLSLLFLIVVIIFNNQKKIYRSKAQETNVINTSSSELDKLSLDIDAKNANILQTLEEYKQADESKKQELLPILKSKAYERTQALIKLLQKNSKLTAQKVFSSDIVSQFPSGVLLEKRIEELRGKVESIIRDDFENKRAEYETYIANPPTFERTRLYITDNPTFSPLSGTEVEINNAIEITTTNPIFETSSPIITISPSISPSVSSPLKIDKYILAGAENNNINVISVPPLDTTGNQKILLAFAKIKNIPNPVLPSFEEIKNRINGPIKDYFERESYGKFSLTAGDVIEKWYDITQEQNGPDSLIKILDDDNINLKNYNNGRLAFIVSRDKGFWSWSTVEKWEFTLNNGEIIKISLLAKSLEPTQTGLDFLLKELLGRSDYPNFTPFDPVFSHELGHSLGARHAASVECPSDITSLHITSPIKWREETKSVMDKIDIGNMECDYYEYGNRYDIMGGSQRLSFSSYVKERFRWIDENSNGKLLRININNLPNEYVLNKVTDKGIVGLWLNLNDSNIFLEHPIPFADGSSSGLVVYLEDRFTNYFDGLRRTVLIPSKEKESTGYSVQLFEVGQNISSQPDNIKIQVKETNEKEGTLTLNISPISNLPSKNFDANSKKERRLGMEFRRSSLDSILNIHRPAESGKYTENYQIKWDQNEKIIEVKIMDPNINQLFTTKIPSLQKSGLKVAKARLLELFNTSDFSGSIVDQDKTTEMTPEEKEKFYSLLIQALSEEDLSTLNQLNPLIGDIDTLPVKDFRIESSKLDILINFLVNFGDVLEENKVEVEKYSLILEKPRQGTHNEGYNIQWDKNNKVTNILSFNISAKKYELVMTDSLKREIVKKIKDYLKEIFNIDDFKGKINENGKLVDINFMIKTEIFLKLDHALSKYLSP